MRRKEPSRLEFLRRIKDASKRISKITEEEIKKNSQEDTPEVSGGTDWEPEDIKTD